SRGGSWCKFWTLDKKVSTRLIQLICAGNGMPDQFGVPLQMQQFVSRKDMGEVDQAAGTAAKESMAVVKRMAKEIVVPDEMMSYPKDYIRTKESAAVMMDSTGWANLKEIKESPDFLFKSSDKQLQGGHSQGRNGMLKTFKRWQHALH